jgi:hypothetical protein
MNHLKHILDASSVSPKTAAGLARLNVPSLFDAYNAEDSEEIMVTWSLLNLFLLAEQLQRLPSELLAGKRCDAVNPATLHAQLSANIATPSEKLEFEERCGWEIQVHPDFTDWTNHVVNGWCPEELKDISESLMLNFLGCLNGLFGEWQKSGGSSRNATGNPA